MDKPIDLIVIETKQNIVRAANESLLPLSILGMIFNEITTEIANKLSVNIPILQEEYNKSLEKSEEEKE